MPASPVSVTRRSDPPGSPLDAGHHVAVALARAPEVVAGAVRLARAALTNPVGAGHGFVRSAQVGAGNAAASVRDSLNSAVPGGGTLVDVFSAAPADVDVVRKLLLGTRNDVAIWTGTAGVEKAVAWSEPLSLLDIKAVAKAHHATVNDVLVTCAAGALHDYLLARDERCSSVTFMVPVNLKPLDLTLPAELGNSFALVQLELPTDQPDLLEVLAVAKRRMSRIKSGHEAALAFRLQEAIAGLSRGVYEASVDLLANRTVGTLTNVPGPPFPVYLAGLPRRGHGGLGTPVGRPADELHDLQLRRRGDRGHRLRRPARARPRQDRRRLRHGLRPPPGAVGPGRPLTPQR